MQQFFGLGETADGLQSGGFLARPGHVSGLLQGVQLLLRVGQQLGEVAILGEFDAESL